MSPVAANATKRGKIFDIVVTRLYTTILIFRGSPKILISDTLKNRCIAGLSVFYFFFKFGEHSQKQKRKSMRKVLLLLSAAVIGGSAFAQSHLKNTKAEEFKGYRHTAIDANETKNVRQFNHQRSANVTVIWEDDFSNGLSNWTNQGGVNGTTNPIPIWEYRGINTTPDTATGTRGAYGNNRRIESLSWDNGFVIFDSDYLDNAGVVGNFGGGAVPTPHYGELISPVIDLSNTPNVQIEFYQFFRYFDGTTFMMLSNDGGTTWVDTIQFNADIAVNAATEANSYQIADVSAVGGGQSQFRFKFHFGDDGGGQGYYFWQIDDVRVIETPDNDLAILPTFTDANDILFRSSVITDGRDADYGYIPASQVSDVTFQAIVENLGAVDQPNTSVEFDVVGPANFNQSAPAQTAAAGGVYSFDNSANVFNPVNTGLYEVTMTVSSDSTDRDPDPFRPSNNSYVTDFNLSDSAMGVARMRSTGRLGTTSFNQGEDGIRFGNLIELQQDDTITSVTLGLSVITRPGATVLVTVRDTFPNFVGNVQSDFANVIVESDFYEITVEDSINGFCTIPIPEVVAGTPQDRVLPADWYIVSAELYSSGNTYDIAILDDGTVTQPWYATLFYYPPQQRWYSNGNSLQIWANFGRTSTTGVGIEENEVSFSLAPNPAQNMVQLNLNAEQNADFHVVITNISGQVMKSETFSNVNHINQQISLQDYAAGLYTVQVRSNEQVITKKLVVTK